MFCLSADSINFLMMPGDTTMETQLLKPTATFGPTNSTFIG